MLFELPKKEEIENEGIKAVRTTSLEDLNWLEKDLENLLANNMPQMIREEHLLPIFQEIPRQREPDILALDEYGKLYIFELKRTSSSSENLLQVMTYGQKFGLHGYEKLNKLFKKSLEMENVDLQEYHKNYFGLDEGVPKENFNDEQKFIIVTDGIDIRTLEAIQYWKDKGLPVEKLTYKIYEINGKPLIDFQPYSPVEDINITETKNHIVNTNYSSRKCHYIDMLDNNKAAAYGSKKTRIDSIKKGDRVFLYHSGVGICAVGRAISEPNIKDWRDREGFEHYVDVHFRKKIDPVKNPEKALSPTEINNGLNKNWYFRQTRFSVDDEDADWIEKKFKEKCKGMD